MTILSRSATLVALAVALAIAMPFYLSHRYDQRLAAKLERRDRRIENVPMQSLPLQASSKHNIQRIRRDLTHLIWGQHTLPIGFDTIKEISTTEIFSHMPTPRSFQVTQELGINSHAYYFNKPDTNCLAIYHQGHADTLTQPHTLKVLYKSCSLLYLNMPLTGGNPQPRVTSRFGTFHLLSHDYLPFAPVKANPLKLFLDPVRQALNRVLSERHYKTVVMVGFSGGGWTTTVYAALDTRISISIPVAGTLPLFLKAVPNAQSDPGDFEQTYLPVLYIADYLDMYVMATDNARTQLQILNQYDNCCNSGGAATFYAPTISKMASAIGGTYRLYVDTSHHTHQISLWAQHLITNAINAAR